MPKGLPSHPDAIVADRLLPLLSRGRSEHACAAALVLGALRPNDPRVSSALARRLRSARAPVRPYVREALARQRTDEALGMLVEGLLGTGVEREQSQRLVLAFGARVLPRFDRVLETRPADPCAHLFAVAVSMRTKAAVDWSMRWLRDAAEGRARAIGDVLFRELAMVWPRALRRHVRSRVVGLIRAGRFASREGIRVAFALLKTLEPDRTVRPVRTLAG